LQKNNQGRRRELWREFSSFPLCFLFYFSGLQTVSKRGRIAAGTKRKTKRKREADFLQRETENGEEGKRASALWGGDSRTSHVQQGYNTHLTWGGLHTLWSSPHVRWVLYNNVEPTPCERGVVPLLYM
jgi:hypothetical protein